MNVREIPVAEKDRWNAFIAASPIGDLLQSFEWGDLKQRSGWEPIRVAVEDDGKIVAAASVLKRKLPRLNKCIFYAPRGPVWDMDRPDALQALVAAIKEIGLKHGAILFKADPPVTPDSGLAGALESAGLKNLPDLSGFGGVQPRCVMKLDISSSLDDVLAGCKPKWRYNIRLAEKKGVVVRSDLTKADLPTFYELLKETAVRDRFLVRGYSYYEDMWDTLVEPGYARLFLAEFDGEAVSGALSYVFGDKCWYTYGASSNRHRNLMPNHLMQWRMIEWAKECGCSVYDFRGVSLNKDGGEDDHLHGLNRFKEGFGAQFVEYIGEYDMPLSGFWYWAWTVGKPRASAILKAVGRRKTGAAPASADV